MTRKPSGDDKRLIPAESTDGVLWATRTTDAKFSYCKYCYEDVPTFLLAEGLQNDLNEPVQILRSCQECGSGLELLTIADLTPDQCAALNLLPWE